MKQTTAIARTGGSDVKLPPHDRRAEQAVLGAMLRDNRQIGDVVQLLTPEDFYVFAYQLVGRAIYDLFAEQKPADPVTVANLLKERREIDDVQYATLMDLWEAAPSTSNVCHYAAIVRNFATHRRLAHYGQGVATEAFDAQIPSGELLERSEKELFQIAQHRTDCQTFGLPDVVTEAGNRIDKRAKDNRAVTGVPTGFIDLDNLTAGFQDSDLVIIGARPSVGKTALVVNCMRHLVKERRPFLFFSLEQARVEIGERLLCLEGRVNSHATRRGMTNNDDAMRLLNAYELFRESGIGHINDGCGLSMLQIMAEARRCKQRFGIQVVFIDYLQLISPDDRRISRNEQVTVISSRLKALARELKVPVVCLSQLSRNIEQGGERQPRLSDLRDSGAIEQDADTVIFLHRKPGDTDDGTREVIVAKQRNGPTGEIMLTFDKRYMEFLNHAAAPSGF